jgi:cytochrome c oxidase subunit IV
MIAIVNSQIKWYNLVIIQMLFATAISMWFSSQIMKRLCVCILSSASSSLSLPRHERSAAAAAASLRIQAHTFHVALHYLLKYVWNFLKCSFQINFSRLQITLRYTYLLSLCFILSTLNVSRFQYLLSSLMCVLLAIANLPLKSYLSSSIVS